MQETSREDIRSKHNPKVIVLSDLHLWGPEDPLYRALLTFLDIKVNTGDKLFIVGDLFDLFIGNKAVFLKRYDDLIQKICKLGEKSVEVFYIEGNHDFQLENIFDECPHVHLYADSLVYEWDNRKIFFCHGDKINWKDIGYQFFRMMTRNFVSQCIIDIAPGVLVDRVGKRMSLASRGYHGQPSENTVQLFRNYACEKIAKGYDFVVMGHSHFMDDMKFRIGSHEGQYVNVGFPRLHKKYLTLEKGKIFFELKCWEDLVSPLKPVRASD